MLDHTKTIKQTIDPRKRNRRPINVIQWPVQFSKTDRIAVNALYFKSNDGHHLFSLNRNNIPIQCWSDIRGISTIKAKIIDSQKFKQILSNIKPKILYLNDGEHLNTSMYNVSVFYDKSLLEILADIEIVDKNVLIVQVPTLKSLRALDPTITLKEYLKIKDSWQQKI